MLFAGHEEQGPQVQRGRFADAVCRGQIAGERQGQQLASSAGGEVLALSPVLLGGAGHSRWHVDAAAGREVEVNSESERRRIMKRNHLSLVALLTAFLAI